MLLEAISTSSAVVIGAVVAVLVLGARARARAQGCPQCGAALPAFRWPTSMRQMLWGGWTCASCGCEIDRKGQPLPGAGTR